MLKTIAGKLMDKENARLVEPGDDVNSNAELYQAVQRHGYAVIQRMFCFTRVGVPERLSPDDFQSVWEGD
jgi:hypothetical protein